MRMVIYDDRIVIRVDDSVKVFEYPNASVLDILNNALYLYEVYNVTEIDLLNKYKISYRNLLELFKYASATKSKSLKDLVGFLEKLVKMKNTSI